MHRILRALNEAGGMKKTSLGLKTGLNYNACLRYVDLLKVLEWVDINEKDLVTITRLGKNVNAKLWGVHERSGQSSSRSGGNLDLDSEHSARKTSSEPYEPIVKEEASKENTIKQIMIVDDEPDVLLTYKSFLSSAGHIVEAFSDVQEAIAQYIIKQSSLDLVILDIRMPDVNGLQLFQKFKAINPQAKIMFVTSLDAAKELVSIFPDIDPEYVLKKPVKKEQFLQTVKTITGLAGN